MPKPNPSNPKCPVCGAIVVDNGWNPSGERKYACRKHRPIWTYNGSKARGRPTILKGRKLTNTERVERSVKKRKRLEKLLDTLKVI